MKLLDTPRTGKLGPYVFYPSPAGQCCRTLAIPHDPKTEAQTRMRANFGSSSRGWGVTLTEDQRERWVTAARTVPSHPSLNQYSYLSGQQLCVKINSTLRCIGQAPVTEPPEPVVFGPLAITELLLVNDPDGGVRLLLNVGSLTEDIMVFGQPPCSAGRMKHRRVYYLGLLGPATNGQCDITAPYTARFGQPRPGQKVFIVVCQTRNGWKGRDSVLNAVVPPPSPSGNLQVPPETKLTTPAVTETPALASAPVEGASPVNRAMYKGSTPDAREEHSGSKREHPLSSLCTPLVHSVKMALWRLRMLGTHARA